MAGNSTTRIDIDKAENVSGLPKDGLLASLVLATRLYNRTYSLETILSGLPVKGETLPPYLFSRAADRVKLTATSLKTPLNKLNDNALPAVLLLDENDACLLLEINQEHATIAETENGKSKVKKVVLNELEKNYTGEVFSISPKYQLSQRSESAATKPTASKNWFWRTVFKGWPIYGEILIASLLINLFALAVPLFIMNVYDRVVPNQAFETLWVLAVGVIIVFLFDFALRSLRGYFIDTAGKKIDIELSAKIFEQILGIQMAYRPSSVGALANTVQAFEAFRDFITSSIVAVLVDLPFSFLYIFVIALIGGKLAWIPITLIPLVIIVGIILQVPLVELTKASYRYAAEKQAALIESLSGAETIKTTRSESIMQGKWESVTQLAAKLGVRLRLLSNTGINFSVFAQQISSVLVVIWGVYMIADAKLSMGGLIACTILSGRSLAPMSQIAALLTRYHQSVNALVSLDEVMHMPTERTENKNYVSRPTLRGEFDLNSISFKYPDQPVNALHEINLHIKAGEKVGVIGRIGSGKTTLAKLLLNFYKPYQGSMLLDKTEMSQIDPTQLRREVGYVSQDITLFYGSIRENIAMSLPSVDDKRILEVSKIAGVDRFVNTHPQGYDFQVGERGQNLSGGQRQAIAVARALLLDPDILLFDEPTNSMDDTSQQYFINSLKEHLPPEKTLILLTHKRAMLSLIDRLIILEAGHVIADGPKEEVLKALNEGRVKITSR